MLIYLDLILWAKKKFRVLNSSGMIIFVFEKVHSSGHGENELDSGKGDQGAGDLNHL